METMAFASVMGSPKSQVRRCAFSRCSTNSEYREHAEAERKISNSGEGEPVNSVVGVAHVGSANEARKLPSRSNSATIDTSEVSLNNAIKLLTNPGMTCRKACGITISPVVFQ